MAIRGCNSNQVSPTHHHILSRKPDCLCHHAVIQQGQPLFFDFFLLSFKLFHTIEQPYYHATLAFNFGSYLLHAAMAMALLIGDLLVAVAISTVAVGAALAVVLRVVAAHKCTAKVGSLDSTHWNMWQPLCAAWAAELLLKSLMAASLRKVPTKLRVKKRALTCGDHRRLARPKSCSIWMNSHNNQPVKDAPEDSPAAKTI
ncbi:hypothetical protein KC19_2G229700 [Ceratodon purpureus]|uniref:Uncharacterized protein n=1 Tax=Ceratodon purpureus TaxID=3225 RepID=A0A8T0IX09_CERPU|nr:hypothetical protein KC19_2G229700 [Ceratodon purpureus]